MRRRQRGRERVARREARRFPLYLVAGSGFPLILRSTSVRMMIPGPSYSQETATDTRMSMRESRLQPCGMCPSLWCVLADLLIQLVVPLQQLCAILAGRVGHRAIHILHRRVAGSEGRGAQEARRRREPSNPVECRDCLLFALCSLCSVLFPDRCSSVSSPMTLATSASLIATRQAATDAAAWSRTAASFEPVGAPNATCRAFSQLLLNAQQA